MSDAGSTISDPEEIARELADIRKRSLEHALTNEQAERMEKLMSKQARVKGAKRARVAGTKVGQTFKRLLEQSGWAPPSQASAASAGSSSPPPARGHGG
eukprot:9256338-Pyramimonas_sp.AAC.1